MPLDVPRLSAATLVMALAACTPSRTDMNAVASPTALHAADSAHQRNPAPKQAYRITMTLRDAPGPFASMKALAQYDVVNKACLSPPKDNPGGHTAPVPTEDVEIPLQKVSDTEYVGTVYADQMADQDLAGHGVCQWKLMQFRVHMKATEEHGQGQVVPSIQNAELLAGEAETVYFNKSAYASRDPAYAPISFGQTDRSRFGPAITDAELFTITLSATKDGMQ
ncbi:MAG: hypothetical protein ABW178_00695 [Pseudoxanthomonas sp.]